MFKVFAWLAVKILRFIYLFYRPLSLREKVTIISRQSDEATLDIKLLSDCLIEHGVETVVLAKTLKKSFVGVITYCAQMMQQMYHIATSKIIVIDGYCVPVSVLPKKKQKVIQMWHALGAIKKFGWQSIDNPDGHSKELSQIMNMHGNYDYVLCPSVATGEFFAEAFRVPTSKLAYYGLPSIDFIRENDKQARHQIENSYPKVKAKKNVLYVPTFRKDAELDLEKLISGFDFDRFNLIIKKHFLDKGDYSWAENAGAIVDTAYSSMEWLRICEVVVTDYSAIAFEAAILERELYIFQMDDMEYMEKVGLNMDLCDEAIGEYVCKSEEELFEKLCLPYDKNKILSFQRKYVEIDMENCTQKLCDFIAGRLVE